MPVTLKDVAEACGVSRQAVSLALNGTGRMSPETRERIVCRAAELGYRRSSVARMMRSGRFGSVGLLMSSRVGRGWIPESLLSSLHDELARYDLHLIVVRLPDEELSEQTIPRLLQEWSCDGLLINYISDVPQRLVELIELHQIPAVWLNTRRERDAAFPDDFQMACFATQQLLNAGHRRIDYLGGILGADEHYSIADRRSGYESAMRKSGNKPRFIDYSPRAYDEEMLDIGVNWLRRDERSTAVVAYTAGEALVITLAALQLGLRVPEDLSVITFGSAGEHLHYTGTSFVYLPWGEVARCAVEMLTKKIENPTLSFASCAQTSEAMTGRTVAPPRATK